MVLFLVHPRNISNMTYCNPLSMTSYPTFSGAMVVICHNMSGHGHLAGCYRSNKHFQAPVGSIV